MTDKSVAFDLPERTDVCRSSCKWNY